MKKLVLLCVILFNSFLCFSQDPIVYLTNGGSGYSVIEGNTYSFTVSLYSTSITDVVVDVSTIEDSAESSDYTPLNTTVTIPAGQLSSNTLTISTGNDSTVEDTEIFSIEAIVTSNNTENSDVLRTIYLYDNDATPTINVSTSPSLLEGRGYNYGINLSNYFSSDVTIDFSTSSGTADTSDYVETNTSVTILAGERYSQFPIYTTDDTLIETDETYTITATVTSGNATNNTIIITVTIRDNDITPTFNLRTFSTFEGNSSYVNVYLNRAYNSDVIIQINTSNGTADNLDYTSFNQSYVISAGYTSFNTQITITDDTIDEPEEFFNVIATVTTGNTTNTSETETATIIDNDGLPDFKLSPVYTNDGNQTYGDSIAAEEGYPLKFRPRLTHPSPLDTDITITTTNGTADASDFTTSTITTTIPAGQYSNYLEELSYPTILDQLDENDENLFINAQVTSGNTYNASTTEEAIILDNYTINAQHDEIISILEVGTTFQVLDNDTFEGLPVDVANLNISLIGNNNTIGITLSPTGILTVPTNSPQGYYYLQYQICESANPTSCDTANLTIIIESPLDVDYTITYVDFNGDTYTSVGDTIEYEFTITNNGNTQITNIYPEIQFLDLDITGGPLASLGAGQTDTTTFTAVHIITQNDINFGYYGSDQEGLIFYGTYYGNQVQGYGYNPAINFILQQSDGLKLNAFVDTNSNGTQENGEIEFPLGQFNYEVNNDGIDHFLYVTPHYLYESNPTTTYNLTYIVDPDYAANNSTSASYSNITVPTSSGITNYDFPITVTPYDDLSVNVSSNLNAAVPGFHYYNLVTYTNNSNLSVPSGTIDFTMDSALSLLNVYEVSQYWSYQNATNVTTTAAGFTYTFSDLEPYQTRSLWVRMSVPTLPTVNLGQLVNNSVDIEMLAGDVLPLNNTSSLTQTIVGSYDPNDVTERHGPEILHADFTTDDYLTYTIRFENTGTANAINIRVEDILDGQLDETTLKMVDASHPYTLERVEKDLEWNFFGINLPPSTDDLDSTIGHGYITFKIKPFPGYVIGDIIPNTAEIYFDFNPAIVTNTWTTEFVEDNLSVDDNTFNNLSVYPNPVKTKLFLSNNETIDVVSISSILGRTVLTQTIKDLEGSIDLESLSNGFYLVTVTSNGKEKTLKVIKE